MRTEITCNQGELQWTKPYGALRVTFHPHDVPQTGFRLCFSSQCPGVNIYNDGPKNLTLLKDSRENDIRKTICITTTGEYAVLYLEAQENQRMAKLNYTVLVRGRKKPRHERRKGNATNAKIDKFSNNANWVKLHKQRHSKVLLNSFPMNGHT